MVMTMTEVNEALDSIEYIDGNHVAKLERLLERDQDAVWPMLTNPARIVSEFDPSH